MKNKQNETPASDGAPCSLVYPISTLGDIFNLPRFEQMQTCLRELTEVMIQARLANDVMIAVAMQETGADAQQAVIWPESINWTDDGNGEVITRYGGTDEEEIFSLKSKVDREKRLVLAPRRHKTPTKPQDD